MPLADLIPEEQKIKYMMKEIGEKIGVEVRPQNIVVEKDLYKPNKYDVRIIGPIENS